METKRQERLEERFESAWKEREGEDCLWWNGNWWSWGRLNSLAVDCEEKLREAGFEKGQRIAIVLPNSPVVIALSLACWRLGGAVAPVNARAGLENLSSTLGMLDPAVVFVSEGSEVSGFVPDGADYGIFAAAADGPLPPFKCVKGIPESEEQAVIFSRSGTSGRPKAVPCTHTNLLSNIDPVRTHIPGLLDTDSVILNVLPNFHSFGFNMSGMLALMSGCRQTVLSNFVPVEHTIEAIKTSGANCIIGVPTIMLFLLGALAKKGERLSGIKFVITGGDRLNVQISSRSKEYLGTGILEGYGLTECSPVVAVSHKADDSKLGTVGQFFDTYEVQIRDIEGKLLDMHEEGGLWVKGPSVVSGYFRDEVNTSERVVDG
ncbi:MAG: AMP-binding protein, partial [Synergistaceae bacterium]|nr:AMP-binding protein [Synergistaceae bacterium]